MQRLIAFCKSLIVRAFRQRDAEDIWTPRNSCSFGGWGLIHRTCGEREAVMTGQPGFFDADEQLKALAAAGDPLERLSVWAGCWGSLPAVSALDQLDRGVAQQRR